MWAKGKWLPLFLSKRNTYFYFYCLPWVLVLLPVSSDFYTKRKPPVHIHISSSYSYSDVFHMTSTHRTLRIFVFIFGAIWSIPCWCAWETNACILRQFCFKRHLKMVGKRKLLRPNNFSMKYLLLPLSDVIRFKIFICQVPIVCAQSWCCVIIGTLLYGARKKGQKSVSGEPGFECSGGPLFYRIIM